MRGERDARNQIQPLSQQEQDRGSHRSSSSHSLHQSCLWHKNTLWAPSSELAPSGRAPHSTPKLCIIQPPLLLIPTHVRAQETTTPEQFSPGNELVFFVCPAQLSPGENSALGFQTTSPQLCSRLWSPGCCPAPCLYSACALLASSRLRCPSSQTGSPVLFQPCLLPMTASPPSRVWITQKPLF